MTKLVRSESFGDCFICVVAMATGKTRQEVLRDVTLSDFQETKYLHMLEATRYLASLEPHELKELGNRVWCLPISLFDGRPCR